MKNQCQKCKNQSVMTIDGDKLCNTCANKKCEKKTAPYAEPTKISPESQKKILQLIKEKTK